jgi:hypothetical protein
MSISEEIIEKAWKRSGGNCECTRTTHWHTGRCKMTLFKDFKGELKNSYGWEAYSENSNSAALLDCEILCTQCYLATKKA